MPSAVMQIRRSFLALLLVLWGVASGCVEPAVIDAGSPAPEAQPEPDAVVVVADAGTAFDAGAPLDSGDIGDIGDIDAGEPDVGVPDGGDVDNDAGRVLDAGAPADASVVVDAGDDDAGVDTDAGGGVADAGAAPIDAGAHDYVDVIDHAFLVEHFGGTVVDATDYTDDIVGFQAFLDDTGVQFFSANEITTPHNASAAAGCGYQILLPDQDMWARIAALALFSDELRALVGEPIYMRNWWRPPCYNTAVGGAAGGDHPDGDAVDLDFQSATSRALAQRHLCEMYWAQDIVAAEDIAPGSDLDPRLNMSVGLGGATIHLGVLSERGRRHWTYSSYSVQPNQGSCW